MIENFLGKINNLVDNNGTLFVIGRGASTRYFQPTIIRSEFDLSVGFNISKVQNYIFDFVYYSKHHESDSNQAKNILSLADITSPQENLKLIKVGSIEFELGTLLLYLNNHVCNKLNIYLCGFDFRSNTEDDDIFKDDRGIDSLQRKIDIESQLVAYKSIKSVCNNLQIHRASFDIYGDIDPRNVPSNYIENSLSNIEIVAEITTNHFGDSDRLFSLIRNAYYAGADSVKLQIRNIDTFYSKDKLNQPYKSPFGSTFRDYRNALELDDAQIIKAFGLAKELGLNLFFSVLDKESYHKILQYGPNRIKLPSTISNKIDFLKYVSKNPTNEIVLSTGMTNADYINFVVSTFKKVDKLFLLHCISSYPVYPNDANISIVRKYHEMRTIYPNIISGYSSHDIGELGSLMAVAAGARMIEKHIKVGITEWAHFDDTAMDVKTEFPNFINSIRRVESMMGSEEKKILSCEHHKY